MKQTKILKEICEALEDKKANDIAIIDVHNQTSICEYLVIADGSNKSQLEALCSGVEHAMSNAGEILKNREGYANGGWILLDYYGIIIHIFLDEQRSFYNLEHIWRDGTIIKREDL